MMPIEVKCFKAKAFCQCMAIRACETPEEARGHNCAIARVFVILRRVIKQARYFARERSDPDNFSIKPHFRSLFTRLASDGSFRQLNLHLIDRSIKSKWR